MISRFDGKSTTDFFPFTSYRTHQKETLLEIQQHLIDGVKDIIVEMPTGSGKSPIAISTGLWSENSYILTSQKILQDQYTKDFAEDLNLDIAIMKGRSNYECSFLGAPTMCNECYEPARKQCYKTGSCLYQIAKSRAATSKVALMNYSYFLSVLECDPQHVFKERKLLICDECHRAENELMGYIEFVISEFALKRAGYNVKVPTLETINEYRQWIQDHIEDIGRILNDKENEIKKLNSQRIHLNRDSVQFAKLSGEVSELTEQEEDLDRLFRRMKVFLNTLSTVEWIFTIEHTEKMKMKKVIFRPLTVQLFANESLLQYGQQRIYLSATILDKNSFCKSLGLNHEEAVFIRVPSTFPVENRRIYFTNTGYMNKDKIDETLPSVVRDVQRALDYHTKEKGIIHCHSYKIAQFIENNCGDSRLLFHVSEDRNNVLQSFIKSTQPLVLVSPSMTEGVDLKDDLARWEIIIKIPYLYIGDKQVARRMKVDPDWYNWQTCLTLVQSYGRIFRSEHDWGTAYIFDSGARSFIKRNQAILPDWFLEACT